MIQKIINGMAVVSFVFTTTAVIGGVVIYNNRTEIVKEIKEEVAKGIAEALPEMVTGAIGGLGMGKDLSTELPSSPPGLAF